MIIDKEFMINYDTLRLYKFPPGFEWNIKKKEGFCQIQKHPTEISLFPLAIDMLKSNRGRLLFFILKIGFELPKFKDLMMFLRNDMYTLRIMSNKIIGKNENGHKTVTWDKKTIKNLYEAMVKYYTQKKVTNDDFLEIILLNTPKDIYDLIMDSYEINGELKHVYDLDKISYLQKMYDLPSPR
tara:strand:- start:23 stop:571 length:549 start_codon:yes stop_codon:yes gene_type:complete